MIKIINPERNKKPVAKLPKNAIRSTQVATMPNAPRIKVKNWSLGKKKTGLISKKQPIKVTIDFLILSPLGLNQAVKVGFIMFFMGKPF